VAAQVQSLEAKFNEKLSDGDRLGVHVIVSPGWGRAPEAQKVGNDDLVAVSKLPTRGLPSIGRARDTMQEH